MADMLGDFICEQSSAPGASLVANLTGAITGRKPFNSRFVTGDTPFYVMDDGVGNWEIGFGVFTDASPDTISRDTVLRNSLGTTAKINFTGTVYVWNTLPSDHAIYKNGSSQVDFRSTDLISMGSVNQGAVSGFRNRVDNGRFDLWDFGTSFGSLTSGQIVANRWRAGFDGSGITQNLSRQSTTDPELLDRGIKYYLRWAKSVAGSGATFRQLYLRMPDVRMLSGRTITIGLRARADAARVLLALATQNFGTGGSPSTLVNTTIGSWTLSTSWQVWTASVALPSVSGKTFGSNNDDYLQLTFNLVLNAADTLDITDIVVQEGLAVADKMFERRPVSLERLLCLHHREPMPLSLLCIPYSTTAVKVIGRSAVPMNRTPIVGFTGTGTITVASGSTFSSTTPPTMESYDTSNGAFRIDWTGFTGLTVGTMGWVTTWPSAANAYLNAEV